ERGVPVDGAFVTVHRSPSLRSAARSLTSTSGVSRVTLAHRTPSRVRSCTTGGGGHGRRPAGTGPGGTGDAPVEPRPRRAAAAPDRPAGRPAPRRLLARGHRARADLGHRHVERDPPGRGALDRGGRAPLPPPRRPAGAVARGRARLPPLRPPGPVHDHPPGRRAHPGAGAAGVVVRARPRTAG